MLEGAVSLEKFCKDNSVSRATAYREITARRLEARKVGRKTIVTNQAARQWLESLPKVGGQSAEADE
jgi:hypothetical protein